MEAKLKRSPLVKRKPAKTGGTRQGNKKLEKESITKKRGMLPKRKPLKKPVRPVVRPK